MDISKKVKGWALPADPGYFPLVALMLVVEVSGLGVIPFPKQVL